ncbi:MAG: hypothetical protein O7D91_06260 [Planctomycetota bacterium]|nr:hypothetical protein [Planctomycetota bacterium]
MVMACPHCGAVDDSHRIRGLSNSLRAAFNVVFCVLLLDIALLFLVFRGLPMRLRRRCNACQGRFYAHEEAVKEPRCGDCNYELTGNVSGTCPECGWKLTKRVKRLVRLSDKLPAKRRPPS